MLCYIVPWLISSYLFFIEHSPAYAWIVWLSSTSIIHALDETKDKFWDILCMSITKSRWTHSDFLGQLLFVIIPMAINLIAIWLAFNGHGISQLWLGMTLGLRLGDALFSHALPYFTSRSTTMYPSIILMLVESLILISCYVHVFIFDYVSGSIGFFIGATPFLLLPYVLKLLKRLL